MTDEIIFPKAGGNPIDVWGLSRFIIELWKAGVEIEEARIEQLHTGWARGHFKFKDEGGAAQAELYWFNRINARFP